MIRHVAKPNSESWKALNWKSFQKTVFRLQKRIYEAVRTGDKRKAKNLQKLLLKSYAARMLAIRQVTQLNAGKKTAGIDGKKALKPKERFELAEVLKANHKTWKHNKLREIPIPKKDGSTRMLKVPTIADRAWQCLVKLALDPAHEATFHTRSYGFRVGRSAHDAQKQLFHNHKFCKMDGSRNSLYFTERRTWKVFNKEPKLNKYQVNNLVKTAFPKVPYSENRFVNVKGDYSPYNGNLMYWSERNSKLYNGDTAKALKKQHHSCGHCGLKLTSEQKVHLHHIDGNHGNWKPTNLLAVHESCHEYLHMGKRETSPN